MVDATSLDRTRGVTKERERAAAVRAALESGRVEGGNTDADGIALRGGADCSAIGAVETAVGWLTSS